MKFSDRYHINIFFCYLLETPPSRKYAEDEGWSGNFVTYFLVFTLFVVVGYLVLHNKNKVNQSSFFKLISLFFCEETEREREKKKADVVFFSYRDSFRCWVY